MAFRRSVNNFVFCCVKHVRSCDKESVFVGNFLHYFIQKKYAAEAHKVGETYGDHAEISLDASKVMVLLLKIKNALAHRKSLKMKNWRHYFMKTHVRHKVNSLDTARRLSCSDQWHMIWLSRTFILRRYQKMSQLVVSLKRRVVVPTWNSNTARKMGKSSG